MVRIIMKLGDEAPNWWFNYVRNIIHTPSFPTRDMNQDLIDRIYQDHRGKLRWTRIGKSAYRNGWILDFADERDYIAMVLKWS